LRKTYLNEFEINGHYLIAPIPINDNVNTKYEFFSCRTDYLKFDVKLNKLFGRYSWVRNKLDLKTFENKLEKGDWDLVLLSFVGLVLLLFLIIKILRKRKNY